MSGHDADELVLHSEPGAPWWPVAIGPALALAGYLAESTAPGGADPSVWLTLGVVVGGVIALIVQARRRFLRVVVTSRTLRQGGQLLDLDELVGLRPDDDSGSYGIRVLGDHPAVPRRYEHVVLVLRDGLLRVAWARDGAALRRALTSVLATRARWSGDAEPASAGREPASTGREPASAGREPTEASGDAPDPGASRPAREP